MWILLVAIFLCPRTAAQNPWEDSRQKQVLSLMEKGQFAKAAQLAHELGEEAQRRNAAPIYRAVLLQLLGAARNQLWLYKDAEPVLEEGRNLLGEGSRESAEVLIALLCSLAEARLNLDRGRQADADLRRALAVASEHLPLGHPRAAVIWDGFGMMYWARGQESKAVDAFRRSLSILVGAFGPDHPDVHAEERNLATALVLVGRTQEALPLVKHDRARLESRLGPNHPEALRAAYSEATALLPSAPRESERILRDVLARWEQIGQPRIHSNVAMFLAALASARYHQKDVPEAVRLNGESLAVLRELLGPRHPQVVAQMEAQAGLLQKARRKKEAAALKKEAEQIRVAHGYSRERLSIDIKALQRQR